MNKEELKKLKVILLFNAEYYGRKLTDHVLQMMAADLEDLPLDRVEIAFELHRRDPKYQHFPLPAAIRARVQGAASTPQEQALEFTASLIRAIRAHGDNWAKGYRCDQWRIFMGRGSNQFWSFEEAVADEFGSLANFALHFINEHRWHHLCEKFHMIGEGMFTAHMRELSAATLRRMPDQNLEAQKGLTAIDRGALPEGIAKVIGPIKGIA